MSTAVDNRSLGSRALSCLTATILNLVAILLVAVLTFPFCILTSIFLGAVIYFGGAHFNQLALILLYAEEGIRFSGRVTRQWQTNGGDFGPTYHMTVEYSVAGCGDFAKDMTVNRPVPQADQDSIALIRLPEYPKSAVRYDSSRDEIDRDFPPSSSTDFSCGLFWILLVTLVLPTIILAFLGGSDDLNDNHLFKKWIGPACCGLLAVELVIGYWIARLSRDYALAKTLYGARGIEHTGNTDLAPTPPKRIPYAHFFNEEEPTFLLAVQTFLQHLSILVGYIFVVISLFVFGLSYIFLDSWLGVRWRSKLLKTFEPENHSSPNNVTGSVVCRQHGQPAIVRYEIDGHIYKKELKNTTNSLNPGDVELLYLPGLPTSACLKTRVEERHAEGIDKAKCGNRLGQGLCAVFQLAVCTLFLGFWMYVGVWIDGTPPENPNALLNSVLFAACISAAFQMVGGLAYCVGRYYFFFRKELLYGAKEVQSLPYDPLRRRVEVQEDHEIGQELQVVDTSRETETTDAATGSSSFLPEV